MKNTLILTLLIIIVFAGCKPATNSKFNGVWIDQKTETGTLIIEQKSSNKFAIKVNGREIEGNLMDDVLKFKADMEVSIKHEEDDRLIIDGKHHWVRPEKSRKNNYVGIWKHANFHNQPQLVEGGFLRIGKDDKQVMKIEEGHIFKGEMTQNKDSKFDAVVMQDTMLVGRRLIKEKNSNKSIYNPQDVTIKINSRGMLELTAGGQTEKFQKKS